MNFYTTDKLQRFFDIFISLSAMLLLFPLLILFWPFMRRPIVINQSRMGRDRKYFTMYKLRTMTEEKQPTQFGNFLRLYALDEIPQFWNVFKGDMSLVGPRPHLKSDHDQFLGDDPIRASVRPGLTGWAQVNGRNEIGWQEKIAFDRWYVENRSLRLYFSILWRTVIVLIGETSTTREGYAT